MDDFITDTNLSIDGFTADDYLSLQTKDPIDIYDAEGSAFNAQAFSAIAQAGAQVISTVGTDNTGNAFATGALTGAATGAVFGAPGAIIGAAVGGLAGFFDSSQRKKAAARELRRAQERRARQIIAGIRQTRANLGAKASEFKRALASGRFSDIGAQLIGDAAARFGYIHALGQGVTSETAKQLRQNFTLKATSAIEGAQIATQQQIARLAYVQEQLLQEELNVEMRKYSNYTPNVSQYTNVLQGEFDA